MYLETFQTCLYSHEYFLSLDGNVPTKPETSEIKYGDGEEEQIRETAWLTKTTRLWVIELGL